VTNVASLPKILQNNSKPAVEKSDWPGEFGGRAAAVFGQKWHFLCILVTVIIFYNKLL
jgi:hypothetical protein